MLETELKCMLDEGVYKRLEAEFEWDKVFEQVNSYYSDPFGLLKKNGITLRVRTTDGINKIQVKKHKNADSPLQIAEEAEFDTDAIPDRFDAADVLAMTGTDTEASLLGSLATLRHSLMYCDGVEICLDKNDYLDMTDYEIEIEYTKEIPPELIDRLKTAGVEFTAPAVGKCSRFMIRLANIIQGVE
ncbi:MAG: CYTH domain-containing protein [Clostridia bacterium]|nr:CYTH domain-containing protein [Clostridia bacterium]